MNLIQNKRDTTSVQEVSLLQSSLHLFIDEFVSRLESHQDELKQAVFEIKMLKDQQSPRTFKTIHTIVRKLCRDLSNGIHLGIQINKDLAALQAMQMEELKKLK